MTFTDELYIHLRRFKHDKHTRTDNDDDIYSTIRLIKGSIKEHLK